MYNISTIRGLKWTRLIAYFKVLKFEDPKNKDILRLSKECSRLFSEGHEMQKKGEKLYFKGEKLYCLKGKK